VEVDWSDWNQAQFRLLDDTVLADDLRARLVDGFLRQAGLSSRYRSEALAQTAIEQGRTPMGTQILRVTLPLGEGWAESGWDSSEKGAEDIIDTMAEVAARTVRAEREDGIPTGWEIDPNEA
jgi:hypothetical protein